MGGRMRVGSRSKWLWVLCLALFASGCKPEKPDALKFRIGEQGLSEASAADREADEMLKSMVVATVGGVELDGLEVKQALQEIPTPIRFYYSNPEKVALFIQNYALVLLYAWMGERSGKTEDGYVRFLWEESLAEAYRDAYLAGRVDPAGFTQAEVDSWLAAHDQEAKEALGAQDQEQEHRWAFARRKLADAKGEALWQARLVEVSKELGFDLPADGSSGQATSGGQNTTKSVN